MEESKFNTLKSISTVCSLASLLALCTYAAGDSTGRFHIAYGQKASDKYLIVHSLTSLQCALCTYSAV